MLQQLIELSLPRKRGLRSAIPEFDFKEKCLFCGEDANVKTEKKKSPNKRDIQVVRPFRTQDTIVNPTEKRNDEWSEEVGRRINIKGDLTCSRDKISPHKMLSSLHK